MAKSKNKNKSALTTAAKSTAAKAPAKSPKAPKVKPEGPGHYTASGNMKHQTNGPIVWGPVFLAAARAANGPTARQGDGVRMALAIGVAELAKRYNLKIAAAPGGADDRQTAHPAVPK